MEYRKNIVGVLVEVLILFSLVCVIMLDDVVGLIEVVKLEVEVIGKVRGM